MLDTQELTEDEQIEKFKLMSELAKEQYDSALKRNSMLDDKAAKLMTLISIIILGYSALLSNLSKVSFLKSIPLFWKMVWLTVVVLTFVALVGTFFILLETIVLTYLHRLNMKDDQLQDVFANESRLTVYWYLTSLYVKLVEEIYDDLKPKEEKLRKSQQMLNISAGFCACTLSYSAILYLIIY